MIDVIIYVVSMTIIKKCVEVEDGKIERSVI